MSVSRDGDITRGTSKKRIYDAIFSEEETISLVKGFITAWMRGQIEIELDFAEDIVKRAKKAGKKMSMDDAMQEEADTYAELQEMSAICLGTTSSTKEQRQQTVDDFAQLIVRLRATRRIKGKFMEYDIEEKLSDLEHRLDATDEVVGRFVDWFRGNS